MIESTPNPVIDPGAHGGDEHHEQVDAERDAPPSVRIMGMIAILTVLVVMSVIGVWQLVLMTSDAEVQSKELAPDNPVLLELRARDQGRLDTYGVVDRAAGRYQIPVDRAMELLVRNPQLMAAPAAVSGTAASGRVLPAQAPAGSAPPGASSSGAH